MGCSCRMYSMSEHLTIRITGYQVRLTLLEEQIVAGVFDGAKPDDRWTETSRPFRDHIPNIYRLWCKHELREVGALPHMAEYHRIKLQCYDSQQQLKDIWVARIQNYENRMMELTEQIIAIIFNGAKPDDKMNENSHPFSAFFPLCYKKWLDERSVDGDASVQFAEYHEIELRWREAKSHL